MSKFEYKQKVEELRRAGSSLKEIAINTGLSKSTISMWCRDIKLSKIQEKLLKRKMIEGGHRGRLLGAKSNHDKKILAIKSAKIEAATLLRNISTREILVSGIALYWAEGSKASSTFGFVFVNSDSMMIRFMYRWLVDIMKVSKEDIYGQISINEIHRSRSNNVLNFWSDLLDLPRSQFAKTFFMKVKQKKVYSNHNTHYGVFRLGVRRSSFLKYKILALIDILKADVAQVVGAGVS